MNSINRNPEKKFRTSWNITPKISQLKVILTEWKIEYQGSRDILSVGNNEKTIRKHEWTMKDLWDTIRTPNL
jgi:hypothetical protein